MPIVIQTQVAGQHNWVTPIGQTIYVLTGTTINYRVGRPVNPQPTLQDRTSTEWGGTLGPAGRGNTVSSEHKSVSNAIGAPSTLTAALGGEPFQLNIVVFDLTLQCTPVDNFANRSTTQLGVDERVSLNFVSAPVGVTAVDAGGLRWAVDGKPVGNDAVNDVHFGYVHRPAAEASAPDPDGTATFVAPTTTRGVAGTAGRNKEISLALVVVGGVNATAKRTRSYDVVMPDAHMKINTTFGAHPNRPHHWNQGGELPSAGFYGNIFLTPKNVSFSSIRWREGVGMMKSTGLCTGNEHGLVHNATVWGDPMHGTVSGGNSNVGCQVNQVDNVHTASPPVTGPYKPAYGPGSPTTVIGHKTWPINWEYTVKLRGNGAWGAIFHKMEKAVHELIVYESGRVTMRKGHVKCAECTATVSVDLGATHYWP